MKIYKKNKIEKRPTPLIWWNTQTDSSRGAIGLGFYNPFSTSGGKGYELPLEENIAEK